MIHSECFVFYFVYLLLVLSHVKVKLVLDVVKDSSKTSNKDSMNEDLIEVKVEPYDLHDSTVNISRHNIAISNNSDLLQNIDKSDNLMTGTFFFEL